MPQLKLNDYEQALLAGAEGAPRQWAMQQLAEVARFFDADDFVEVSQVHLMADTESLGETGVAFLEGLAGQAAGERRVKVPTVTDPRGADFSAYKRIKQDESFVELERRADKAFRSFGILMTDTCINYQTISPPVKGEHVAFGDTGSSIYTNSVLGARTNFEGACRSADGACTTLRFSSRPLPARQHTFCRHQPATRSFRLGCAGGRYRPPHALVF